MKRRRYRVEWLEAARLDLEAIADRLWLEAPLRADKVLDRIIDRADSLWALPERGRVIPELRDLGETAWREVHEPPWRIVYRVHSGAVEIHAVLDARRSLEDLLRDRLIR